MDDDFDFDSPRKSQNANKGRRARGNQPIEEDNGGLQGNQEAGPRPTRRVGGWGEDAKGDNSPMVSARGRRKGETVETFKDNFTNFDNGGDSDNEIPMIPELEDNSAEPDINAQIAMAPNVSVNKVATYKELDNDLQRNAHFSMLDGEIDLKLLSRYLVAEADTKEQDKLWDWDHMFTEVSSELRAEWDTDSNATSTAGTDLSSIAG